MRKFIKRKRTMAAVGGVALLIAAGGAYAYFTTTGAGTGSGSVGTSTALVLHGTAATALYPGTSSSVTFTVDNSSTGTQRLGTIHYTGATTDVAHSACVMTDFTMSDVTANESFAAGAGQAVTATGTLLMAAQPTVNQDACKGAPLTLNLTSN